jgi:hypothetical protein
MEEAPMKKVLLTMTAAGALLVSTGVSAIAATRTHHENKVVNQHVTTLKHDVEKHNSPAKKSSKVTVTMKHAVKTNHRQEKKTSDITTRHHSSSNTIPDGSYTDTFNTFGIPVHGHAQVTNNETQLVGTDYVVFEGKPYSVTFNQNLSGHTVTGGTYTIKSKTGSTKTGTLRGLRVNIERSGKHLTTSLPFATALEIFKALHK